MKPGIFLWPLPVFICISHTHVHTHTDTHTHARTQQLLKVFVKPSPAPESLFSLKALKDKGRNETIRGGPRLRPSRCIFTIDSLLTKQLRKAWGPRTPARSPHSPPQRPLTSRSPKVLRFLPAGAGTLEAVTRQESGPALPQNPGTRVDRALKRTTRDSTSPSRGAVLPAEPRAPHCLTSQGTGSGRPFRPFFPTSSLPPTSL